MNHFRAKEVNLSSCKKRTKAASWGRFSWPFPSDTCPKGPGWILKVVPARQIVRPHGAQCRPRFALLVNTEKAAGDRVISSSFPLPGGGHSLTYADPPRCFLRGLALACAAAVEVRRHQEPHVAPVRVAVATDDNTARLSELLFFVIIGESCPDE